MDFEKIIIRLFYSRTPESYDRILVRWKDEERSNRLIHFEDLVSGKFQQKPLSGRFYNKNKWRSIDYFYKVIDVLNVSKTQLETLERYKIDYDLSEIKFTDAQNLINEKEKQLEQIKEAEDIRVGNLPITSYSFNKLKKYGIKVSKSITRFEGADLIHEHEMDLQLSSILDDFRYRKQDISENVMASISAIDEDEKFDFIQCLDELNMYFKELQKYDFNYTLPSILNLDNVQVLNDKIDGAMFELEDVIEQIKDRFFSTFEGDFKVVGRLPKSNFRKLGFFLLEKILDDNKKYDFNDDILDLIALSFPDVNLKADYY